MKKLNLKQKLLYKSICFRKRNNLWLKDSVRPVTNKGPGHPLLPNQCYSLKPPWGGFCFPSALNSEFLFLSAPADLPRVPPGSQREGTRTVHHRHAFICRQDLRCSALNSQHYPSPGNASLPNWPY